MGQINDEQLLLLVENNNARPLDELGMPFSTISWRIIEELLDEDELLLIGIGCNGDKKYTFISNESDFSLIKIGDNNTVVEYWAIKLGFI